MYLHSVTTTEGKKFLAEKNEIEFPIAFAIIN
jgi:hypothetical protein